MVKDIYHIQYDPHFNLSSIRINHLKKNKRCCLSISNNYGDSDFRHSKHLIKCLFKLSYYKNRHFVTVFNRFFTRRTIQITTDNTFLT